MKRATINDVALTAGVSTFTASRALRGKDHVAAATRDKVLTAAKELNYTASRSAAALASGRTNRIAMLARERLAGWFMGELFDGLYDELSRARYDLTVYRAGSVEERAEFFTRLPANRNADALIVSGFSATDEEADHGGCDVRARGGTHDRRENQVACPEEHGEQSQGGRNEDRGA